MKRIIAGLSFAALALGFAQSAQAHERWFHWGGPRVVVQPQVVVAPPAGYYAYGVDGYYAAPDWRAREEWREREAWRARERWEHEQHERWEHRRGWRW